MIKQYEIYWINLDPTVGAEIGKERPCLIISPNEINDNLQNVIIAPITNTIKGYPTRVNINHLKRVNGEVVLDQVRTIDKSRLSKKPITKLDEKTTQQIKSVLYEIFIS